MDIETLLTALQKNFYEFGKNIVQCNQPSCFESFYYYSRFGRQPSNYRIIHKLILLDKIILTIGYNILPIELRNYIYCYFLNLEQCEWIKDVDKTYIDWNMFKNSIFRVNNIVYFDDHQKNSRFYNILIKNAFGHCNGVTCHVNGLAFRSNCYLCGNYYCIFCENTYLECENPKDPIYKICKHCKNKK